MADHSLLNKIVNIKFYKSNNGKEPVREWLKSLPKVEKKIIGEDLKTVEFGWPLGMPLVKNLGNKLWEVRSTFPNGICRIIFILKGNQMVLLHAFVKKQIKPHKKN